MPAGESIRDVSINFKFQSDRGNAATLQQLKREIKSVQDETEKHAIASLKAQERAVAQRYQTEIDWIRRVARERQTLDGGGGGPTLPFPRGGRGRGGRRGGRAAGLISSGLGFGADDIANVGDLLGEWAASGFKGAGGVGTALGVAADVATPLLIGGAALWGGAAMFGPQSARSFVGNKTLGAFEWNRSHGGSAVEGLYNRLLPAGPGGRNVSQDFDLNASSAARLQRQIENSPNAVKAFLDSQIADDRPVMRGLDREMGNIDLRSRGNRLASAEGRMEAITGAMGNVDSEQSKLALLKQQRQVAIEMTQARIQAADKIIDSERKNLQLILQQRDAAMSKVNSIAGGEKNARMNFIGADVDEKANALNAFAKLQAGGQLEAHEFQAMLPFLSPSQRIEAERNLRRHPGGAMFDPFAGGWQADVNQGAASVQESQGAASGAQGAINRAETVFDKLIDGLLKALEKLDGRIDEIENNSADGEKQASFSSRAQRAAARGLV